jgi:DNA-directed RNA polymerase specialized sigma24 family protein
MNRPGRRGESAGVTRALMTQPPVEKANDVALVDLITARTTDSPDEIYRRYGATCYRLARAAPGTLPEPQQEALALACFGDCTQREIAGLIGAPLGTVRTRMLVGLRRLREALAPPVADPGGDR